MLTAAGPAWVVFLEGSWETKPAPGDSALSWEAGARWDPQEGGGGAWARRQWLEQGLRCCRRTRAAAGVQAGGPVCRGAPWVGVACAHLAPSWALSLDSLALHPRRFPLLSFPPPSIQDFLACFLSALIFWFSLSHPHLNLLLFLPHILILFPSFLFSF